MGSPSIRLVLPLIVACAGCGTELDYYAHLIAGQAASLANTRPIEQVLADGSVTPEQADKLRLVQRVRAFGIERIGLTPGDAYTLYEDDAGRPAAYAVSASAMDRLEAYRWEFPFVGASEVKGFFDQRRAQREKAGLEARGYDVFVGQVAGFSTLGVFPDPVRAANLELDDADLAIFILHEMTHSTIFKPGDFDFNESMAEFVGRTAAVRSFEESSGVDSTEAAAARARAEDLKVIDAYVIELFDRMTAWYGQPISSEEKVAGRQAQFDAQTQRYRDHYQPQLHDPQRFAHIPELPLNNAAILAGTRYQAGLDVYEAVFAKLGGDFAALLDVLSQAAAEEDSRAFLHAWLDTRP